MDINNVRDFSNARLRSPVRIEGNKVMAKWPLRGRDVTGDPISTWLQFLCVCIVCGSMYCALYVRMCVRCVYGSLYVL